MDIKISNYISFRNRGVLPLVLFIFLVGPVPGLAQEAPEAPTLKEVLKDPDKPKTAVDNTQPDKQKTKKLVKLGPDDEFGRGVPRETMAGFFAAVRDDDFKRAAEYLDLRYLPRGYRKSDGPKLARQLKVILDRTLWVDMDLLSTDPKGHKDDGLPRSRDLVGQVSAGKKKYDILLQHVPREDGVLIWKISKKTVRKIPVLYKAHGYGYIGEKLSQFFPAFSFMGLAIWQWIFLVLILIMAAIVAFPVVRIVSWVIIRKNFALSELSSRFINGPIYVLLTLIIFRNNYDVIHPSLTARAIFEAGTIFNIVTAWMLILLAGLFREYWALSLKQRGRENAIVLLRPAFAIINVFILFIATIVWLDNIGFSVTTVLAGLGIGGIAVALATQKSIENFIGALTLYLSAPVRVGDYCRFGDKEGTIEEIGLRATKLRTLEQSILTVPNAEFAGMQIENFAGRAKFRFSPIIRLRVDTSPDQVRYILIAFQRMLYAHPKVLEKPLRVRFEGFGEFSFDIKIHCYIDVKDLSENLFVAQDLNLRILEIISEAGSEIAIPASIEYQTAAHKLDESARQKTEAVVEQWRDKGEMTMELTPEQIKEIKNTTPFPG